MKKSEVLYHYCSTESFYKIISERQIKLSALSFSNDSREGRLAWKTIEKLCIERGLNRYQISNMKGILDFFESDFDSHGFCLSEEGDLLSQWKMYADDANGISIGFSKAYLDKLRSNKKELTLSKVMYTEVEHKKTLTPIFEKAHDILKRVSKFAPNSRPLFPNEIITMMNYGQDESIEEKQEFINKQVEFSEVMSELLPLMFTLKTDDWKAECEWRLFQSGDLRENEYCEHMPTRNSIVRYDFLDLEPIDSVEPILEITLGSKHLTPELDLRGFLKKYNFNNVEINESTSSYR